MKTGIQLSKLRIDGGTQPRVKIDTEVVVEYADRIAAGDDFPAVEVFYDGVDYWLAEGFHRYHAHVKAGKKTISCNVRKGTVREAILFSCGANSAHGLRRSTKDKQRAIETLLNDDEWSKYGDRKIADICCVSDKTVGAVRERLRCGNSAPEKKRIGADGKSYPATQPKRVVAETSDGRTTYYEDGTVLVKAADREPGDDTEILKAEAAKRRNNGKELVTAKERREAQKAFGVVTRFVDKLKRHDDLRAHLAAIAAILEGKA